MANAVFSRYLEIEFPQAVSLDGRRVDDERCAIERRASVGRCLDIQPGPRLVAQIARQRGGLRLIQYIGLKSANRSGCSVRGAG